MQIPNRIVDISMHLENEIVSDPDIMIPKITYETGDMNVPMMEGFFDGLTKEDLPGEEAWTWERIELTTHNGTHLDAPRHFNSTDVNGDDMLSIDEVPLDWCFRPGVKLDFRGLPDGHIVTGAEVEAELERIGHDLQPLDIVVVNTRASECYGTKEYLSAGIGMGREATLYLTSRGVRVTGIDAWSWDAPFTLTAKKWEENKDPSVIWEGHYAGRDIQYCHMEKMLHLEELPANGFHIACFPCKIKGASAGWTRAVAMFFD
jgi:kynurenine formamidase